MLASRDQADILDQDAFFISRGSKFSFFVSHAALEDMSVGAGNRFGLRQGDVLGKIGRHVIDRCPAHDN